MQGFPRVNGHLRVGLGYLHGELFKEYLELYIRPLLIKGVPSIMMDLREFYSDQAKVTIIGNYLSASVESMEREMTLREGDDDEQDPTVLLWLYYFMS